MGNCTMKSFCNLQNLHKLKEFFPSTCKTSSDLRQVFTDRHLQGTSELKYPMRVIASDDDDGRLIDGGIGVDTCTSCDWWKLEDVRLLGLWDCIINGLWKNNYKTFIVTRPFWFSPLQNDWTEMSLYGGRSLVPLSLIRQWLLLFIG